ncbi:hypothetical protein [Salipiger mangrovisoli]|uniref:SLOG cluster 4 domain-containing protein n=1 Tax=Salipiger mangrovisoli TaxID=2865933 RepID=UPI003B830A4E
MQTLVICAGRSGVVAATCKGVLAAGGLPIGLLAGFDLAKANPFVAISLSTGFPGPHRWRARTRPEAPTRRSRPRAP